MLNRLLRLILKEFQVTLGDKRARLMLIMPVVLQTLIFPFAATLEVRNATLAIYDQDGGQASVELIQRLSRTAAFSTILMVRDEGALRHAIDQQETLLALQFPADFSRRLSTGSPAPVQVLLDGRRSNSGQIATGYVSSVLQAYGAERGARPASILSVRNLYNPNLDFKWHVLPSLVAIITTIGCLMVTALSVAREREEGTFEQLLVSPLTPAYIMAGKAVPGVVIAVAQGCFIALAAVWGYGVPFTGSVVLLLTGMVCYGLALAGVGLFISSISENQQQAFLGVFTFMSPAVMLSGYVAPIENMPRFFQWVAVCNPLAYFIPILKGTFLKHYGFAEGWAFLWPMLAIALVTLSLALRLFRRHIA
jgi:ABC-2 type transport system permease protein